MSIMSSLLKKPLEVIEHRVASAKIEIKAELTVILSKLIVFLAIGFFILMTILFASLALALHINGLYDHPYAGYLWIGGIYLLLSLILYTLNKTGVLEKSVTEIAKYVVFGPIKKK
ncbi:MAG: phage holin family protein [Fulvivirga sp.]|nr:phage holin family protein [Fulvivirga sp.]